MKAFITITCTASAISPSKFCHAKGQNFKLFLFASLGMHQIQLFSRKMAFSSLDMEIDM